MIGQPGKTREGHDCPAAQARLKMENDAGGWLGCVRPAIGVQGTESEVRALVHEPSVLSPQRQVARKSIIGATADTGRHLFLEYSHQARIRQNYPWDQR